MASESLNDVLAELNEPDVDQEQYEACLDKVRQFGADAIRPLLAKLTTAQEDQIEPLVEALASVVDFDLEAVVDCIADPSIPPRGRMEAFSALPERTLDARHLDRLASILDEPLMPDPLARGILKGLVISLLADRKALQFGEVMERAFRDHRVDEDYVAFDHVARDFGLPQPEPSPPDAFCLNLYCEACGHFWHVYTPILSVGIGGPRELVLPVSLDCPFCSEGNGELGQLTQFRIMSEIMASKTREHNQSVRVRAFQSAPNVRGNRPLTAWQQDLEDYPDDADLLIRWVNYLRNAGHWRDATKVGRKGLERFPEHPAFYALVSNLENCQARFDEAERLATLGCQYAEKANGQWRTLLEASQKDARLQHIARPWEAQVALPSRKVGRNEPCPCGSGKKYKKCCLR